jgi:hypothetical protein
MKNIEILDKEVFNGIRNKDKVKNVSVFFIIFNTI